MASSIWISLGPLIVVNVFLLCTVLAFRPIYRKRGATSEVEDRHSSKLLNKWMREYWLWLTDPLVRFFIKIKLTPNRITTLGVLISFCSVAAFALGHFGLGGWLMIFSASFDIFDGRVARLTGQETKSGAYYDSVMDRVSEGSILAAIAFHYRFDFGLWIALIALLGSYMVSYSRSKGGESGVSYSGGNMQRPERIVYLGVGAIFSPVFAALSYRFFDDVTLYQLINYFYLFPLSFVALMTWVTSYNRIKTIMKILDERS